MVRMEGFVLEINREPSIHNPVPTGQRVGMDTGRITVPLQTFRIIPSKTESSKPTKEPRHCEFIFIFP